MEKKGICGICSAGCWIIADYDKKGRIAGIRPDKESQMGIICRLAEHAPEIIYSKDRLLYPMKRKGDKGSYGFERISWDQAYETIVEKLISIKKQYGPESNAIYTGVGSFELSFCDIYQPKGVAVSSASSVLFPFGSPNTMGVGALCYVAYGMIAPHVTMGRMFMDSFSDIENSELIVVWGTNPATDLPPIDMKRILKAQKQGAEVVVIDPRKTATVKMTDGQWIPIRPGTDGALALGMINVLVEEELYDDDFVINWTTGFDDLVKYTQHYRPEVVEHITGVPKEDVVSLARKIAQAKGASKIMYTGMEYSNSGVQNIRAALILWALAGQLDVPGGLCFAMDKNKFPINREGLVENPDTGPRLGKDKFPVYIKYRDEAHAIALPRSVLEGDPYKIRSLIILGSSIITSWPNPGIWKRTLNELDFLVTIDRQLTRDSAYADIVLPATTYFENISYMTYGSIFKIRERMIEPLGEARSDVFILSELARRLGYGHLYPQTEEELLCHVLAGSGFSLDDVRKSEGLVSIDTEMMQYKKWEKGKLRKDGKPGFETPTGKFEIASTILEEYGYEPLPKYIEPKEGPLAQPELVKKYPLVFNSGARVTTSFHTQHHGIRGLFRDRPEPTVMINCEDAAKRGIVNGDKVMIKTPRANVVQRAIVTGDIKKGCIDANHACGSPVGPQAWQNSNINDLTDLDNYDPISGFPVYKSLLCEIVKVKDDGAPLVIDSGEIKLNDIEVTGIEKSDKTIYLDNNATTPIADEVKEYMVELLDVYGNPSSIHSEGKQANKIVEQARRRVAQQINCTAKRIIFTGSGTEADNIAIKGVALANKGKGNHIITSSIDHPAVLNSCRWLATQGFEISYLPVDKTGRVNPDDLKKTITDRTCLVTIMLANNVTGSIQPVKELSEIARDRKVIFHTDAVQAMGKIPVDVDELGVDLLTISAHKLYGPKGVGALYIRKGIDLEFLIHGGGQEYGIRSATENVMGIAGFGKAMEMIPKYLKNTNKTAKLRDRLQSGINDIIGDNIFNGNMDNRLSNTLNITIPGIRGESIVLEAAKRGLCFSSGSACHSGSSAPSYVLLAMGLTEEEAHCSLRFSLGYRTSEEEIIKSLDMIREIINSSKNIIRFIPCK
ncbi:MAG: aminotransferase class V-fold PLP-dependent enzyme [Actinomycetota bacterium]|nr:MAG: aminotransferase class V-fold PLP-dependent enzyme [Actinomycetota bacterium]